MNSSSLINALFIFVLAGFIGFEVIRRVSPLLHTPLMSLTNALGRDRGGGRDRPGGRAQIHALRRLRIHCRGRRHQQYRRRLSDHRPYVEDVQIQSSRGDTGGQVMTAEFAGGQVIIELVYLIASVLFIFSLKWMSSPTTARHGIWAGEIGMLLAICGTLLHHGIIDYRLIAIALVLGTIIGVPLGRVAMTAVPQRTALSHAFGALCVTLVGSAEFYLRSPDISRFMMSVLSIEVILGGLTVTGSLMAAGKLQEILPQRPLTYKGQNFVNFLLLAVAIAHRRVSRAASRSTDAVSVHDSDRAGVRRVADHPDRRRGHADRHFVIEWLCRPVGCGHGLRSR